MRKTYFVLLIAAVHLSFEWVSFLGCPSGLLSSFGCKIPELGRAGNDLSQADVFAERRGRAQGVQCFQPKGSSRCTSLSHVPGLSVWTWGRRSGSQEIPVTSTESHFGVGANARWRQRFECHAASRDGARYPHLAGLGRWPECRQTLWTNSRPTSGRVGRISRLQAGNQMGRSSTAKSHVLDAPARRR